MLAALLANLLFSFSIICANRSAKLLGGITANFWRTVLATLMLGAWAHAFGKGLHGPALPVFLLSGLVGFGMGDMSLYKALPLLGSRLTMLTLHCLAAPLASLIEWLWLGTKLTMVESLSALVILAGVATALIPIRRPDAPHHAIPPRGILFACLAALGQALGAVFSRKAYLIEKTAHFPMDGISAAYQRILGGVFLIGIFYHLARRSRGAGHPPGKDAGRLRQSARWVMLNALAGPTLGVSCMQWALQTTPSGVVLPILATIPLTVIPFAYWMEGDRPSRRSLIGGIVAVAGAGALALEVAK